MASANAPLSSSAAEPEDFSIILGGPLYQLYRKAHLVGTGMDLLKRRLIGITLLAWVPLVVLAILERHTLPTAGIRLAHDIDVHARCLVAIPLLILAEYVVHMRLGGIVRQFTARNLIAPEDMPRYEAIRASALRLRNSVAAELVQLALAISLHWLVGSKVQVRVDSWIGSNEGGSWHYTAAGTWYTFVTMTIFRMLLFRWYYRIFIWYRFLWQVRGLPLQLDALHPDRAAGLGFLAGTPGIFTPLMLAHSVVIAGIVQNKIWSTGAKLAEFYVELGGVVAFLAIIVLTPLFFFGAKLAGAKRKANAEYGALASRYVAEFRQKWLAGRVSAGDPLVGSGDIQSLADLSGAYDAVRETRFVPITKHSLVQLLAVACLPLLPLALNEIPWDQLLTRVAGFLF